jgi:hypothetical protein
MRRLPLGEAAFSTNRRILARLHKQWVALLHLLVPKLQLGHERELTGVA